MSTMSKAAAAVLVAGLVGILSGKVTDGVYYGADGSATVKRGFSIEVSEASAEGAAAPAAAAPADINTLLASADVKAGADIFSKKCTTCHNGEKGAANKIGPHLTLGCGPICLRAILETFFDTTGNQGLKTLSSRCVFRGYYHAVNRSRI